MNFLKKIFRALFGASTKRKPTVKAKRVYNHSLDYDGAGGQRVNTDGTPMQYGGRMDISGRPFGSMY